jgi:hypothetical protein
MMVCTASSSLGWQVVGRSPLRGKYFRRSGRLRLEESYRLVPEPLPAVLVNDMGWSDEDVRFAEGGGAGHVH